MLKRLRDTEEGFTLIELLVVVIIIGILAAIAIPTFLSQRERGWQAELTSSVRNTALEIESAATVEGGDYAAAVADLAAANVLLTDIQGAAGDPVQLTAYNASNVAFCMIGTHDALDAATQFQLYDSTTGGLADVGTGTCAAAPTP